MATADPEQAPPLRPDSIPAVDLRLLSQSELHSLSTSSNWFSHMNRCEDVVIPKIDRSVFNESAGSRKQTYSRLRLAPPNCCIHRRMPPRIRPSHTPLIVSSDNALILSSLKQLFPSSDSTFQDSPPTLQLQNNALVHSFNQPQVNVKSLDQSQPNLNSLNQSQPNANLLNQPEANVESLDQSKPNAESLNQHEANVESLNQHGAILDSLNQPEPNVGSLNQSEAPVVKRKRGRPRKNENVVTQRPPEAKRMRHSTVKKEVVYDEGRDKEIVNSKGVEVNLRELGGLEDPYGEEIRRRSEGLTTADELLGFLRGLNGQWGTTRKKRRVVDATDFGDALPKGWRLSLCIKKKEGRVWLFCRRYISPSGRQFESCKDISMYLLSILGEENMDKPTCTHNNRDDSALKGSSENAANHNAQEDLERNGINHNPPTPPISSPTDCEKHTYGIVGPIDVHVDEVYKCLKCFLIFEEKSELWEHQSLSHKNEKSQLDSSLPDWSIVIGGVFVCNICHSTFYEIDQYNGHVGTHHVINENKTAERTVDSAMVSSETDHKMSFVTEANKIDEVVHDLDMNEDVLVEESGDGIANKCVNDNNVPETDKAPDASMSVSVSDPECVPDQDIIGRSNDQDPGSETRVRSSSICEEKGSEANINDACVYSSFDKLTSEKGEVLYNESSSGVFHGISNGQDAVSETRVHTSSICEEKGYREDINDRHLSSSFDELASEKGKVVNNESSSGVFHGITYGQDAVSEAKAQTKGFRENINDTHISSPYSVLTSEKGKVVNNESSSGVFHGITYGQDADTEAKTQTKGFQENINNAHNFGPHSVLTSEKEKVVNKDPSSGVFHGITYGQDAASKARAQTKGFQQNINDTHISSPYGVSTSEKGKVVNKDQSSVVFHGITYGQDAISEARFQTKGFQENINDTHISSPFGALASEKGKVVNKDSSSSGVFHNRLGLDEARLAETKKLSESENLSLFSNTLKKAADNSSLISSKNQDSFQKLGFASVGQVAQGFDENRISYNISRSKLDEQYEVRNREFDRYVGKEHANKEYFQSKSVDKSGEANLDEFQAFRNNESINNGTVSLGSSSQNGVNANVMDFNTGKNIEFSSLVPSGNNQAYGFQDGLKFDDIFGDKFDENIHELSLAFGNPNSLYEDTVGVNGQKKDGLNCSSVVSSKINDTFDVQTDLSMVNNSMVQDLKRVNETRGFPNNSMVNNSMVQNLKRGDETSGFQNNDNPVYSGRTWGDFKSDEFRNSEGKKFMMGSGSSQMWKTAQGNHPQSGLVNPHAQIQSPNFHSFDIMSQKAQEGLFRHTERYNPSRSEPVEFRFLTDRSEHNPNALQSGSRVFPYNYNTGNEQGFDSTYWMGKNAVMPNMSGRNLVTCICTWCRNEFYLPAMVAQQQAQAGVGSLCPNCSAGIPGQANML